MGTDFSQGHKNKMSAPSKVVLLCMRKCRTGHFSLLNFCRYTHKTPLKYAEQQKTEEKNDAADVEAVDFSEDFDFDLEEDLFHQEEMREKLRRLQDCSGLNEYHKKRLVNEMPDFSGSRNKNIQKRFFQRRLYGIYGKESGVNPGIMWPSRAELVDLKEIERDWTPSFHELVQKVEDRKQAKAEAQRLREENVEKSLSKMDVMIAQYEKKKEKDMSKAKDAAAQERIEELLQEFRDTYGFSVQPKSSKFKAFRSKRIQETKVSKKKASRLTKSEKHAKAVAELIEHGSGSKH